MKYQSPGMGPGTSKREPVPGWDALHLQSWVYYFFIKTSTAQSQRLPYASSDCP